jgi:hypothetical protein
MLRSRLFKNDARLQACLVGDSSHVLLGDVGTHVSRIQLALMMLDDNAILKQELASGCYGPATARSVLDYKNKRNIVNRSYQTKADDIVGKMTIARMDAELLQLEMKSPTSVSDIFTALPDSAPAYRLKRASVSLLSGRREEASAAFAGSSDSAELFRRMLATLGHQGGGSMMVDPEPGQLRAGICSRARGLITGQLENRKFDDPGVKACWQVTRKRGATKADEPEKPIKTHWCGIFATWLWSQAGINAEWAFTDSPPGGISNGPYLSGSPKRVSTSNHISFVAPGDILVERGGFKHHVLVLRISADGTLAEVAEGNAGSGAAHETVVRIRSGYNLPQNIGSHYFYSVDSTRSNPVKYGDSVPGTR